MTFFAKRSHLVQHYAWKGRQMLYRVNGPVSTWALLEMKRLYMELGLKIQELEGDGHWEKSTAVTATTPTGKAQATTGCASRLQDTEPAS